MITGFRWNLKGAQHYYNVNPDLTTFGKGIANGYSVSLLGGRKEIMSLGNLDQKENLTFFCLRHTGQKMQSWCYVSNNQFL